MLIQTENPNLLRDTKSRAIIVKDDAARKQFYKRKEDLKQIQNLREEMSSQISSLRVEVDDMKTRIDEIKILLKELLENASIIIKN